MALTQLTKIDGGGISTTSDYRVGVITATKFVGPFDGTAGNFSGVVTATNGVFSGNISAVDGTFSGNVSIAGTLTYEDVTNIDSVGIITAQSDIHVGAGVSAVGVGTFGSLDIGGDIDVDGHTNLDNVNIAGVTTFAGAIDANGDLDVDGHTNLDNVSVAGVSTFSDRVTISGGKDLFLFDDGVIRLGNESNSIDFQMFHDGSHTQLNNATGSIYINNTSTNGSIRLSPKSGENGLIVRYEGAVQAYHSNTKRIETTSTGAIVTGILTATDLDIDGHTNLDNVSIAGVSTVGTFLQVLGPGGTSDKGFEVRSNTTQNTDTNQAIRVRNNSNTDTFKVSYKGKVEATSFHGDGSNLTSLPTQVTINNNADNNIITGGSGVNLYAESTFTFNGTDVQVPDKIKLNTNGSYVKENQLQFKSSGTAYIDHGTTSQNIIFRMSNSSSLDTNVLTISPTGLSFHDKNITNVGTIALDSIKGDADDNTNITFAGSDVITFKAGSTSPALTINTTQVKVEDDQKLTIGEGNDLTIWHNQSHSIIKNTTGRLYVLSDDLWFRNQADNSSLARFMNGGEVFLYNNDNLRLTTTAKGITVTGEVAASQDYPNFRPTLDFNFSAEKKLDPRITYQRTGPASFIDEFGKVVLVGDNAPRFDHDPTTRESKGLLIEESRTNLFLYGIRPGNNWTGAKNGTFEENTTETTAPDGTFTATKWTFTNNDPYLYQTTTLSANTTYTMSIWVKAGRNMSGDWLQFRLGGAPYSTQGNSIIPADGTWRRITYTRTIGGSAENSASVGFEPQTSPSGNPAAGDVIYIWGAQLEVGDDVSSFIPTNGVTVTRGAENVKIDGDDFTDFYNQSEGTLVSEFMINDKTTLTSGAIANINALSGNTYANSIMFMEIGTASGYYGRVYKNSNGTSLTGSGNITTNGIMGGTMFNRVSFAWSDTNVNEGLAAYRNGDLQGSSTTETNVPTNMTELRIGRGWSNSYINAHIKRLMYYSKRLPINQLATLTA